MRVYQQGIRTFGRSRLLIVLGTPAPHPALTDQTAKTYGTIRCLLSRFRTTLDTSQHPSLHDVMAEAGSSQHKWPRSVRQYCVNALDENKAARWAGALPNRTRPLPRDPSAYDEAGAFVIQRLQQKLPAHLVATGRLGH